MASDHGDVIECKSKEDLEANMGKGRESGKLVIIDFTATWCGPCRFMAPMFAQLSTKYPNAIFLKVDVDELQDVATTYEVRAMPTFLFFKDGEKVYEIVGANKAELEKKTVILSS